LRFSIGRRARKRHRPGKRSTLGSTEGVGVAVGFAVSLAASLAFNAFTKPSLALGVFGVATLLFAAYVRRAHDLNEWLNLQLAARDKSASSPRELLTDELVRGLVDYGLLRTRLARDRFVELAALFEYVRGQNFLNLMSDGFGQVAERLQILADHRFEPFAVAVDTALRPGVSIECINAEPDRFYDVSAIDDRLAWARQPSVEYWLIPEEDVRFAMLIFDDSMAIVYTKPPGRSACNFTEALFTDDRELVSRMSQLYKDIRLLAEDIKRAREIDAATLLEQKRVLLSSARASV
jgi:hypothetical protein